MMRSAFGSLAVVASLVLVWQALYLVTGDTGLASPAATLARLITLMGTAEFWDHVSETAQAFALSAVISAAGGIALGMLLGMQRTVGVVSEPILVNLYSLPKVTLYPVVLLIFGLGMSARVAFGVMHGLIPLALFTMNAIVNITPVYLRTAGALRLSAWQTATTVILPAIVPDVLAGARLGFSLCLLGVLIGEMFASRRGLGSLVTAAMGLGDMPTVLAVAILLAAFAVAANVLLLALDPTRSRMA